MLGSYGPHPAGEAYTKNFDPEESPSGMLARSGSYNVRSRVIDDDGEVYAGQSVSLALFFLLRESAWGRVGMVIQTGKRVVILLAGFWALRILCIFPFLLLTVVFFIPL